ncbi:MAG: tetratricopeptide repeat protein, partial [Planctomycetota bacterium]
MGPSTPTRISLLTALAAGGAIITCPAVTAAALGGAALTALSSIASSTLGEEVYQHFAQHRPKSLHNHHLQQLAGNALADLIDFYEKQNADPNYVQRKLPVFRRKDAELTALAHAARQHWHALDLTGDSEPAADHRLHEAFTHHDRTTEDPYIPDDEWAAHLATLEPLAHKHRQGYVTLTDDRRQALAAYIAPRFTSAVRELVKADFDPKHGTGGRTFIALHLDLMHAQSVTLRRLDAKSDQQIRHLQSIESGFDALRQLITNNLPPQLKGEYFDQLDGLRSELRTTRDALADRLDLVLENQELVLENQARDSRKIDRLLELAESDEDQLRERLTHEIRKEFADKLTEANNARLAAEALLDVRDVPGIEDALREQGGKAIVNALLEKAQAPDVASVELHRKIAEWAYLVGEIDQAFQSLQIILSHHPDDSDAINRLGHIYLLRGELPAAEQQYRQLLKISPDDKTTRATALGNLGVIAKTRGELDQAEKLHNESLQIERQLERLEGQANSLCNLGNIAHTRGELDLAEKLYNQSLQIERQLGRLEGQAIALSNLGNIAHTR